MQDNFKEWWQEVLNIHGFDPDPDNPEHFYDYRAAHKAGEPIPGPGQHMSSKYKSPLHPNRFVSGEEMGLKGIALWDTLEDKPADIQTIVTANYKRNELLKKKWTSKKNTRN